jgi:hypothetical protein
MHNTFQILAGFLERHECEVEGRAMVADPPAEAQRQLRLLAAGALPEPDQPKLFAQLNQNPEWVGWLAREVKARRQREA